MADAATVTIPHSVRTHAPRSATQRVGTGVRGCSRIDRVGVIIGYPTSGAGACRRLVSTHEASGAMAGVALRLVRSDRPIRRGDGSGPMRLRPDLLVQAAGALHIPLGVPIRTPGRKPTRTHLVGSLSLHGRRRKRPELTVLRADKSPRNTVVSPRSPCRRRTLTTEGWRAERLPASRRYRTRLAGIITRRYRMPSGGCVCIRRGVDPRDRHDRDQRRLRRVTVRYPGSYRTCALRVRCAVAHGRQHRDHTARLYLTTVAPFRATPHRRSERLDPRCERSSACYRERGSSALRGRGLQIYAGPSRIYSRG